MRFHYLLAVQFMTLPGLVVVDGGWMIYDMSSCQSVQLYAAVARGLRSIHQDRLLINIGLFCQIFSIKIFFFFFFLAFVFIRGKFVAFLLIAFG